MPKKQHVLQGGTVTLFQSAHTACDLHSRSVSTSPSASAFSAGQRGYRAGHLQLPDTSSQYVKDADMNLSQQFPGIWWIIIFSFSF